MARSAEPDRTGQTGPVRAIIVERAGGPEVLTEQEVPDPQPGPGDLLVRLEAAGGHVVDFRAEDFGAAIEAVAGPKALDVVYDGVGRATFERGLDLLRPRGLMVTFGNASGPVDPVSPLTLMSKGSLFLTRPTLAHYV